MKSIKHQVTATIIGTALALTFAAGCGADVDSAPSDIGVGQEEPAPPKQGIPGSPDSIDRPSSTVPSVDASPCVFSADAAERQGGQPCLS